MARSLERRALALSLGILAAVGMTGWVVDRLRARIDVEVRRSAAESLARGSAFALEHEMARSLASAATIGVLASTGSSEEELDLVAARLLELGGSTANLQLTRGTVISRMWPLEGNQSAVGFDLLRHPQQREYVLQLMGMTRPLLYGPFELVQGGEALALRVPVRAATAEGGRFLGLASAIVRVEGLLRESRLEELAAAGLNYRLVREAAPGRPARDLASSPGAAGALLDPVSTAIELPGQAWRLEVAPRGGWQAASSSWLVLAATLLVGLLAALLAYRVLSLPAILRREVAARTADLQAANQEQRRAEEAQRQSQKLEAVGRLAGGVAHDFNNLLAGIMGHADLLAMDATPGSEVEQGARTILQAAQRAAELTRQLLAFARVGHSRREVLDLHQVVREALALLERTVDKSIRFEVRLEAPDARVLGDAGHLQQVLMNLVVNARDAMPSGGTVKVETSLESFSAETAGPGIGAGRWLVISVSDTGSGIDAEHLPHIFEPFFTTKAEGLGTGLGLATVYGIVRDHGGAVRVYSEPGVGSRFSVYLPAHQAGGAAATPPEEPAPRRGSGTVLVVDDEEVVRLMAGRVLSHLGYTPVLQPGGAEALAWLEGQRQPPAAVLLDIVMPGLDGPAVHERLRALYPDLPVVVSSGFSSDGRAQRLLDAGAAAFIQKPYRAQELGRVLAESIRR